MAPAKVLRVVGDHAGLFFLIFLVAYSREKAGGRLRMSVAFPLFSVECARVEPTRRGVCNKMRREAQRTKAFLRTTHICMEERVYEHVV